MNNKESLFLKRLAETEDLAEKKLKIYSRLLMDAALAENMKTLSLHQEKRKQALEKIAFGKVEKEDEE